MPQVALATGQPAHDARALWRIAPVAVGARLLAARGRRVRRRKSSSHFDSDVEVAKDGELTVTETLRVQAEGSAIRHGIYRDFPLTFRDAGGTLREVDFQPARRRARRSSRALFTPSATHGIIRIYAGDKDVAIRPGEHTYVFRYRTGRQIRWFDGKPELNWNVTGNFWRFPILCGDLSPATCRRRAPGALDRLHRPRRRARHRLARRSRSLLARSPSRPRGRCARRGSTVVAEIARRRGRAAEREYAAVVPTVRQPPMDFRRRRLRRLCSIYYFAAWEAVGRDPKRGTIIPLFHPPQGHFAGARQLHPQLGLRAREVARVHGGGAVARGARPRSFRRHRRRADAEIDRQGTAPAVSAALPAGEARDLHLGEDRGRRRHDREAPMAKRSPRSATSSPRASRAESRNRFFRRNLGYVVAGLAMTVAVVDRRRHASAACRTRTFPSWSGCGFGGFIARHVRDADAASAIRRRSEIRRPRALRHVARLCCRIRFDLDFSSIPGCSRTASATRCRLLWSLVIEHYPFPLRAGDGVHHGQRTVLSSDAGADRARPPDHGPTRGLQALSRNRGSRPPQSCSAPEITAERFEALLPYAVALDVEKPWSDAFAAALRRAHPGEADPMYQLPAGLEQRRRLVGQRFRQRSFVFGGGHQRRLGERRAGLVRFVRFFRRRWRFGGGGGGGGGGGW